VFRRGRYAGGKKVGKGNLANVGDTVKKGQTLGYVEQLGTFVDVKVCVCVCGSVWRPDGPLRAGVPSVLSDRQPTSHYY
jgi:hypothetical protein